MRGYAAVEAEPAALIGDAADAVDGIASGEISLGEVGGDEDGGGAVVCELFELVQDAAGDAFLDCGEDRASLDHFA